MKTVLASVATLGLIVPQALAHGVELRYKPQQVIHITARYDSGEPMANARVQVFAPDRPQQAVISGTTNAQGEFQFVPDRRGQWQVQVRQGGHGGLLTIPVATHAQATAEVALTAVPEPPRTVSLSQYTPAQITVMILAVLWGAIGTACFAWSRRRLPVES
ncbi:carboxypeptidase-like regulatory domain-containing protein [Thermosynechococcus sp. QKsg1]|uniref:carboxypeptidase-like regulatory domain-containing protein n=1 Tax=unclassified Thermosynechococcus TaxID=2622553 RepID=UPI00122E2850|nr:MULTISPECIES: carboxypeptidase-like regulatory domain-containing protein [unclassified Thermosynechococcus]QEQ01479.1 carboxypeptidase regulatory-like domain-containing protein [Thermosynechococcus sp. CL-1]WJI23343.1 carboxypeptidase-like regulatory domain-containing protein [Thermosynechococcus sp. B0]WNC85963.1 carboxypeptidase-like regulatory domain-containing protein [Thermosynechococcus sp. QKsg1]